MPCLSGSPALRGRARAFGSSRRCQTQARHHRVVLAAAGNATNGTTKAAATSPSAASTARTLVDIVGEGTLSTLTVDGVPLGTPVAFCLDTDGQPIITLSAAEVASQLSHNPKCSLLVQGNTNPIRALASVSLLGEAAYVGPDSQYQLRVDKCLYMGGLDQSTSTVEVDGETFRTAEPDVLRSCAVDLVTAWNEDRAEDIYRIVASFLEVSLSQMAYAELLWVDHLGMYVRAEVAGAEPRVVRVPFYRPVTDERDVRSVITMAAQLAWEKERNYVPPTPAALAAAAEPAGSPANN